MLILDCLLEKHEIVLSHKFSSIGLNLCEKRDILNMETIPVGNE